MTLGVAMVVVIAACSGSKAASTHGTQGTGAGAGSASSSSGAGPAGSTASAGTGGSASGGSGSGGVSPVYPPLPKTPATPELWYWNQGYLSTTNPAEPAATEARIDQAVAAGYTGVALWDSAETFITRPGWDTSTQKAVVAYAASKGMKIPKGSHAGSGWLAANCRRVAAALRTSPSERRCRRPTSRSPIPSRSAARRSTGSTG